MVPPLNATELKAAIVKGPVAVTIDASSFVFQLYQRGTISTAGCGTGINHYALAIGYGVYRGEEYFLIKNSFGTDWGIAGYA